MASPCRLGVVYLCSFLFAGCGGSQTSTPTAPTVAPTRIISISGLLSFGDVVVGSSREATITISNGGNSALSVTGLSVTGEMNNHVSYSWASGTVSPGGSQVVAVRFVPNRPGAYNGTLIVAGDQNSGTNSIAISGNAIGNFSGIWVGGHRIDQCGGTGSISDLLCTPGRPSAVAIGTVLGFNADITQSGTTVTGTVNLGGISGPVTGVVSSGSVLNVRGNLTSSFSLSATITSWNVTLGGGQVSWSGSIGYEIRDRNFPGVAVVTASMNNVNKR